MTDSIRIRAVILNDDGTPFARILPTSANVLLTSRNDANDFAVTGTPVGATKEEISRTEGLLALLRINGERIMTGKIIDVPQSRAGVVSLAVYDCTRELSRYSLTRDYRQASLGRVLRDAFEAAGQTFVDPSDINTVGGSEDTPPATEGTVADSDGDSDGESNVPPDIDETPESIQVTTRYSNTSCRRVAERVAGYWNRELFITPRNQGTVSPPFGQMVFPTYLPSEIPERPSDNPFCTHDLEGEILAYDGGDQERPYGDVVAIGSSEGDQLTDRPVKAISVYSTLRMIDEGIIDDGSEGLPLEGLRQPIFQHKDKAMTNVQQASNTATSKLRDLNRQESEASATVYGHPYIRPYDRVLIPETHGGRSHSVHSVEHFYGGGSGRSSGGATGFRTELKLGAIDTTARTVASLPN